MGQSFENADIARVERSAVGRYVGAGDIADYVDITISDRIKSQKGKSHTIRYLWQSCPNIVPRVEAAVGLNLDKLEAN